MQLLNIKSTGIKPVDNNSWAVNLTLPDVRRHILFCLALVLPCSATHAQQHVVGKWSNLIEWPHVPSSVAALPDGKLVTWSSNELLSFPDNGVRFSYSSVYDPVTTQFTETNNPTHDMFCAGISLLSDGTVFAAGGNPQLQDTSTFDPVANRWQQGPYMNHQRWYGTTLTLPDDSVFASFARGDNNIPELLPRNGSWSELPDAAMTTLYNEQMTVNNNAVNDSVIAQWNANMQLAPNGRIFHAGPTQTMHWLDVAGSGQIEPIGPRLPDDQHRQGDTFSMYGIGKVLLTGGSDKSREQSATATAMTIDINRATPEVERTDSMLAPRVYHNAVVLPNAEVMIVGGNTSGVLFDDTTSVFETEIWNSQTSQFRTTAPISVGRNYHSVAILMKDGRVFSAGGGLCGRCDVNHPDAQIYSPPYLFNTSDNLAPRPFITNAPEQMMAGESGLFTIRSGVAINRLNMLRVSSNTHSVNTDERLVPVDFERVRGELFQINLNDNPNILVPGNYWVFALDNDGVPSVGRTVNVAPGVAPPQARLQLATSPQQAISVGQQITLGLQTAPGHDNLSWSIDTLPPGLSLDPQSGTISGVATLEGDTTSEVLISTGSQATTANIHWQVRQTPIANNPGISAGGGVSLPALLLMLLALAHKYRCKLRACKFRGCSHRRSIAKATAALSTPAHQALRSS